MKNITDFILFSFLVREEAFVEANPISLSLLTLGKHCNVTVKITVAVVVFCCPVFIVIVTVVVIVIVFAKSLYNVINDVVIGTVVVNVVNVVVNVVVMNVIVIVILIATVIVDVKFTFVFIAKVYVTVTLATSITTLTIFQPDYFHFGKGKMSGLFQLFSRFCEAFKTSCYKNKNATSLSQTHKHPFSPNNSFI